MRVRHIHSSSRFDRPIQTLIQAMRFYITLADIISYTEVRDSRRKPLREKFSPWRTIGGRGEAALAVFRARWKVLQWSTITLDEEIAPGARPVIALRVLLKHRRRGKRLVVYVFHVPAHHDRPQWLASWHKCIDALSDFWKTETQDSCIFTGDWNKDWRVDKNKDFLRNHFPKGGWTWGGSRAPRQGGTHHDRLIDYSVTTGRVISAKLLRDDSSSDHRPLLEIIKI